ncbi:MAG TPA: ABC transporter substrate-binding protein [Candidatus Binatia bacterium]|jgi:NitT/TauT family transport system substrate-binding protein
MRIVAALVISFVLFSTASAQEKKSPSIVVGYSALSGSFAPLWVAFDQGLFTKYGIDVRLTYIQGNRVMMSALTAGEVHLYQGAAEGLIRLISGGGDGIFIASQYNIVGHYVLMTDPRITRLEELRGQRIALDPTSPTYGYMLKALEHIGLRKEDVIFVQFGTAGQPERTMAVLRKQAAATILTAPNTYAAEKQGLRKFSIIRDLKIRQLITVTGMTRKFLRERRDLAEAFLRGYVEGIFRVKTEKDTTMRVIGRYTRQRDPEVLSKFYDDLVPDLPRIPYIDDASTRATLEAMQVQGPPLPKLDPKSLYDNSLLNALANEGFVEKLKPRER